MVKIMENPIKMDDLGVPLLLETPICLTGEESSVQLKPKPQFHYTRGGNRLRTQIYHDPSNDLL